MLARIILHESRETSAFESSWVQLFGASWVSLLIAAVLYPFLVYLIVVVFYKF